VEATAAARGLSPRLLIAAGLGAAVAIALGVYGRVHDPSEDLVFTLFFSSTIGMKVWFGTVALAFAVVQIVTALWLSDTDTRVLVHSMAGCAVYGAFAAKVTIVRSKGLPGAALPVAGGLMFAVLVLAWYTSALWFINEQGWPDL
jgi:uncharacterized protein DUF6529